ncbi:MAG: SAM-dependent methyltransferase [Oscillospiraceae bacterium]|nr:SAM-dependent methyltransferase [Oscillospiraceae bacterium]
MNITLSKRLQCMADKIEKGSRAADVGTDHGYIPAWLIQQGICEHVIASDIKPGPLQTAVNTAISAGVDDKIDFRLCSGLDAYKPDEFDAAVIAGMGGETVLSILEACPWTKDKKLIIQPQSKLPELRCWMNKNGFAIEDAELVYDTGRIYLVWTVRGGYTDEKDSVLIDRQLLEKRDPLLGAYLDGIIKRELKILKGMERGAKVSDEELAAHRKMRDELKHIKEETETWQK